MVEVLLTIKYEKSKSKMVLMLDRRAKRGKRESFCKNSLFTFSLLINLYKITFFCTSTPISFSIIIHFFFRISFYHFLIYKRNRNWNNNHISVILENIDEAGHRIAQHINMDNLNMNSNFPSKNIIFLFHQSQPGARMAVYIDCIYRGVIPLKKTFRELANSEDNLLIEAVSFYSK